jgi:hypothetical protein
MLYTLAMNDGRRHTLASLTSLRSGGGFAVVRARCVRWQLATVGNYGRTPPRRLLAASLLLLSSLLLSCREPAAVAADAGPPIDSAPEASEADAADAHATEDAATTDAPSSSAAQDVAPARHPEIDAYFEREVPVVVTCIEENSTPGLYAPGAPLPRGNFAVAYTLTADGKLENVRLTRPSHRNEYIDRCVLRRVAHLRPPASGAPVEGTFVF